MSRLHSIFAHEQIRRVILAEIDRRLLCLPPAASRSGAALPSSPESIARRQLLAAREYIQRGSSVLWLHTLLLASGGLLLDEAARLSGMDIGPSLFASVSRGGSQRSRRGDDERFHRFTR
jgi:hypothetical protein